MEDIPPLDLLLQSQDSREYFHVRVASAAVLALHCIVLDTFLGPWGNVVAIQAMHGLRTWGRWQLGLQRGDSMRMRVGGTFFSYVLLMLYTLVPFWKSYLVYEGLFGHAATLLFVWIQWAFDESQPLFVRQAEIGMRRDVLSVYILCALPWRQFSGVRMVLRPLVQFIIAPVMGIAYVLAIWSPFRTFLPMIPKLPQITLDRGIASMGDIKDVGIAILLHELPKRLRELSRQIETALGPRQDKVYSYAHLKPGHVRMLVIEPSKWPFQSMIEASLISAELHMLPQYQAVSYRWGQLQRTSHVVVDGAKLSITQSAADVLAACRCAAGRTRSYIWLDAICINQSDDEEKTVQVGMMRDIYSSASRVILFPGGNWKWRLASRVLHKAGTVRSSSAHTLDALEDWVVTGAGVTKKAQVVGRSGSDGMSEMRNGISPHWQAFMRLVQDDYWTRVWIIQEICVGRNVELDLAGDRIPWDLYAQAVKNVMRPENRHLTSMLHLKGERLIWNTGRIESFIAFALHAELKQGSSVSTQSLFGGLRLDADLRMLLECLLFDAHKMGASDQRDKIFAVIGIASDSGDPGFPRVDYSQTLPELLEDVARYLLLHQKKRSMRYLGLAGTGYTAGTRGQCPSWVPRLDETRFCLSMTKSIMMPDSVYRAGGRNPAIDCISAGHLPGSLALKGVFHDYIFALSSTQPLIYDTGETGDVDLNSISRAKYNFVVRIVVMICDVLKESPDAIIACMLELREALTGDYISHYEPQSLYQDAFAQWFKAASLASEAGNLQNAVHSVLKEVTSGGSTAAADGSVSVYDAHVIATCYGRCFGMTSGGRLCSVPPFAKEGDAIFIPYGAQTPFIVRQTEREDDEELYEIVGEAYVQGIMKGQALDDADAREATIVVV